MRVIFEAAIACVGTAFLLCAVLANQRWLDGHFLPSWFLPHGWWVLIESAVRVMLAAVGVSLALWLRPRLGRLIAATPARVVQSAIAAALALVAGELVLRQVTPRPVGWLVPEEEPRRRRDPRLGWTLVPARTGHSIVGGRVIDYSLDPAGYRVRRDGQPVDPGAADDPVHRRVGHVRGGADVGRERPAQVGAMMGTQSANLAVPAWQRSAARDVAAARARGTRRLRPTSREPLIR